MFHKVLKIFHDGIIMIEDTDIIYHNSQILKMFNIQKQNLLISEREDNEAGQILEPKQYLINAVKNTKFKQNNMSLATSVETDFQT